MKKKANILNLSVFRIFSLTLIVFIIVSGKSVMAQDETDSLSKEIEKIKPFLKISSIKNSDETRTLLGTLSYRDKETREVLPIKGLSLVFLTGNDSLKKLGTFETDQNGKAKCIIPSDYKYFRNDEGFVHLEVNFEGNDKFEENSAELDVVDLMIDISLDIIDSIKTVTVKASKVLGENKTEPLNEETIPIFVARMFSHMKVGEITLTDGEGTFEFPADIPGDTLGMVTVIAKFDEHEMFATVMKSSPVDWGIKTTHHNSYHPRSLWTSVAPVWMIVTLSIMLLGVWGHYFFVVIQLIRLKRIGKNEANEITDLN